MELRTLLLRDQKEVRHMLLGTRGKGILVHNFNCHYVESRTCDELGYIVKEISKQNVEADNWFILATYKNSRKERI